MSEAAARGDGERYLFDVGAVVLAHSRTLMDGTAHRIHL